MEKRTRKFFGYNSCHFFLLMLIFAFAGFLVENAFKLLTRGFMDSSHHFFPATFTYSIVIFVLYGCLGTPDNMRFFNKELFRGGSRAEKAAAYILYAVLLAIGVFVGELTVGLANYYATGAVIWDYNNIPLNWKIGCPYAFTSLPTTLAFTAAGWLFMKFLFAPLMRLLEKIPVKIAVAIGAILGALLVGDYVYTLIYTQINGFAPVYWTYTLP